MGGLLLDACISYLTSCRRCEAVVSQAAAALIGAFRCIGTHDQRCPSACRTIGQSDLYENVWVMLGCDHDRGCLVEGQLLQPS